MLTYQAPAGLLKDKIILVTGASDGIGREAALHYAEHGAEVILMGRSVEKLQVVYDLILASTDKEPVMMPLDLLQATAEDYQEIANAIQEQYGRLDGLLHSAGLLGTLSPFEHIDINEFERVMKVNVTAELVMTQTLLPLLQQAPQGRIIFTSSGVGKKARAFWASYSISKFATEGMMQLLADEVSDSSLRVNCINPGATRTSMRASAYPGEDPQTLKTPAELMPLYLYLMGPDSQDVNGESIDAQPKRKPNQ